MAKDAREFFPISLRLQTINHRPNAFLLTQMARFCGVPYKEIRWSGDWFYESIAGNTAMFNGVFVKQHLAKKLVVLAINNFGIANEISRRFALEQNPGSWILDGSSRYRRPGESGCPGLGVGAKLVRRHLTFTEQSREAALVAI